MINFRVIARVFSQVIIIEGLFMLLAAGISLLYGEHAAPLFLSAIITLVTGVLSFTPLRDEEKTTGSKEGYIILAGVWIILSLFGTLPYMLSGSVNSFTDAFFESMSGFTTTGATVFTNVESHTHGVLFWRSSSQWIGGLGFILISLSVLPVVKSLNIQLTITDFTGQAAEKINPRIVEVTKRLIAGFVILTGIEALLLIIGGMTPFDAICHSFTTISTGGFSTRNTGIAAYSSPFIMIVLILFMFIAGTNLTLIYYLVKRNFSKITGNNEFIFYVLTIAGFMILVSGVLWFQSDNPSSATFLEGSFHVISIITTTGFHFTDYSQWGSFLVTIMFMLMFTGGTSGSASSSLKIVRLLLTTRNARHEIKKLIHPNAIIPVRLDHKTIPDSHVYNILVFICLYFIMICSSSLIISLMDYDVLTSVSTSASLLGNIGPGLGKFGPFMNYASVPDAGKWFFSLLMLIGRLELFSVLVLFSVSFYRR